MNTSKIDDQFVVDEDPQIVISIEGEDLSSSVYETCGDLHGETKVMVLFGYRKVPPISPSLLVQRPIACTSVGVPFVVFHK